MGTRPSSRWDRWTLTFHQRLFRIERDIEHETPEGRRRMRERKSRRVLHTARSNGHEPYAYLKDVLERLPIQPARRLDELLPHHWRPSRAAA